MLENTEMHFADAEAMGLSHDEWLLILKRLDRTPNLCELGIFSAMWSEHCSYKSSKKWLKTLPTEGPQVIQGPGENAGVVDIGRSRDFLRCWHGCRTGLHAVEGGAS